MAVAEFEPALPRDHPFPYTSLLMDRLEENSMAVDH